MNNFKKSIAVVVPVYNSEKTLEELYKRLRKVFAILKVKYEVIFVDDGSQDESWLVIKKLAKSTEVNGIRMMKNFGQHNALLAGIREAKMDLIVTIDDDLQNPPEEIPKMLTKLNEGFDVVYGAPETEQHGFFRNLASITTKIVLQKFMGAQAARHVSAFRIFKTNLRNAFFQYNSSFVNIEVLLTWATGKFSYIKVKQHPRAIGVSHYTLKTLIVHAMNMMTGFSTIPLQIASMTGFVFTIFGMFILSFVLGRYLISGSSVPGFAFLASIISIFSGAQLFALGIIGEYLSRIHFRSMAKPSYTVAESLSEVKKQFSDSAKDARIKSKIKEVVG